MRDISSIDRFGNGPIAKSGWCHEWSKTRRQRFYRLCVPYLRCYSPRDFPLLTGPSGPISL